MKEGRPKGEVEKALRAIFRDRYAGRPSPPYPPAHSPLSYMGKGRTATRLALRLSLLTLLVLLTGLVLAEGTRAQENFVYLIRVKGDINAGIADFIGKSVERAEGDNVPLLIRIDTPGGLLSATERIVKRIQGSEVRVVVWVSPAGAWAYSAGTFILLASDVAVMDNNTVIGAAQPRPEDPKITQAMAEWIESIAKSKGRPAEIVRSFVENNRTMDEEEAMREGVIDLVTGNVNEILTYLGLGGAEVREMKMSWISEFLRIISNPQVVFILFILGLFGLIAEITTPGVGVPGVGGAICLLLSLWGMGVLRISYTGVALIGLGIILLAYELLTSGFGVFGSGGVVALLIGLMMVDKEPWMEIVGTVMKGVILGMVLILAVLLFLIRRSVRRPTVTGKEGLVGKVGKTVTELAPEGLVSLDGELWTAICGEHLRKDEEVIVKEVRGIKLIVEKYRKE